MMTDNTTVTINREDLLDNYKMLEDLYISQGKAKKFTGSELFEPTDSPKKKFMIINNHNIDENKGQNNNVEVMNSTDYDIYEKTSNAQLSQRLNNIQKTLQNKYIKDKFKLLKNNEDELKVESKSELEKEKEKEVLKQKSDNNLNIDPNNLEKQFKDSYNNLIIHGKCHIRDERENQIKISLTDKLKPQIQNKIYNEEFHKIEDKFKKEVEQKLKEEVLSLQLEGVEKIEKQIQNNYANSKELEDKYRINLKEEFEKKFDDEIIKKEKEIKTNFLRKLEVFKTKIESNLKNELERKKKDLIKQINDLKAEEYSKRVANKLKKKRRSKHHNRSTEISNEKSKIEKNYFGNNEKIEKDNLKRNASCSTVTYDLTGKQLKMSVFDNKNSTNNIKGKIEENETNKIGEIDSYDQYNKSSFNLKELNKKIKSLGNLENLNFNSNKENIKQIKQNKRDISLIFKDNINNNNTLKEELEYLMMKNLNSGLISPPIEETVNNEVNNYKKIEELKDIKENVAENEKNILKKNKYESLSLKMENSTPISMREFGNFIVNYIEKEENYKLFLENNCKKMTNMIKVKFKRVSKSDHCLLDYLLELWDNLEISYQQRYVILIDLLNKNNVFEIYTILDNETEILTGYFQKAESSFQLIRSRERKKSILQAKLNRNELLPVDTENFKKLTKQIEIKIVEFKEKYNLNIIWRGLMYEWIINYESWLSKRK